MKLEDRIEFIVAVVCLTLCFMTFTFNVVNPVTTIEYANVAFKETEEITIPETIYEHDSPVNIIFIEEELLLMPSSEIEETTKNDDIAVEEPTTEGTISSIDICETDEPTTEESESTTIMDNVETEPVILEVQKPFTGIYGCPFDLETQKNMINIIESYSLEPELIFSIAYVESRFNPLDVGDNGNSLGMYQIQPKWHPYTEQQLFDIYESTHACCQLMTGYLLYEGDLVRALQHYNTGSGDIMNEYSNLVIEYMTLIISNS